MRCTRLAANTGCKKVAKNRNLGTIAQLCRAISSQLTHVSTIGKKLLSSSTSGIGPLPSGSNILIKSKISKQCIRRFSNVYRHRRRRAKIFGWSKAQPRGIITDMVLQCRMSASIPSQHQATITILGLVMAALCNRGAIIFLPCSFFLLSSSSFFSSPNLSGRRSDVCHTSTHGVALVRIQNAGLKCAARGSLQIQDAKKSPKITISVPSHNFVGPYLRN